MPFGGRSIKPASAARIRLNRACIQAFAEDFDKHGPQAIIDAREKDPIAYLRLIVALAPMQIYLGEDETASGQRGLLEEVKLLLLQREGLKDEKPLNGG